MRKFSTPAYSTQKDYYQKVSTAKDMKPRETTTNKILQFAATYRVEKVSNERFIDYFLN